MPINHELVIPHLETEEMRELDYRVMKEAYAVQNTLGRLCDEVIYKKALASQLRAAGMHVIVEYPIELEFQQYQKTLHIDLIVNQCVPYELKAATSFAPNHEQQLLTYMLLIEAKRGTLINFRTGKVDSKFVNTRLTLQKRRAFVLDASHWSGCPEFFNMTEALLRDWGTCLDQELYTQAIVRNIGLEYEIVRPIPMMMNGEKIGQQKFCLYSPDSAFHFSSFSHDELAEQLHHVKQLVRATSLRSIFWVNVGRECVRFDSVFV